MTAVIVGASSGLGRALCEALAAEGRDLVLVASDIEDCRRLAGHLELVHGIKALPVVLDARHPEAFRDGLAGPLRDAAPIGELFLPMGAALDEDGIGAAEATLARLFSINYASVVLAVEAARPFLADGARIVGFGSIAAVRPRSRNVQYSAAKAALSAYFASLRHALAGSAQVAQFYVVGYVESGQSFGKTQLFPALPADRAARRVLDDGARDFGIRFLPRYWGLVAMVLRLLPWRIFSRLGF